MSNSMLQGYRRRKIRGWQTEVEQRTRVLQIFVKKMDAEDGSRDEYELAITGGIELTRRLATLAAGDFTLSGIDKAKRTYKQWTEKAKRLAA